MVPRGRREKESGNIMVRRISLDNSKHSLKLPAQGRKGKELRRNLGPRRHKGPAKSSSLVMTLLGSIAEDGFVWKTEIFRTYEIYI